MSEIALTASDYVWKHFTEGERIVILEAARLGLSVDHIRNNLDLNDEYLDNIQFVLGKTMEEK